MNCVTIYEATTELRKALLNLLNEEIHKKDAPEELLAVDYDYSLYYRLCVQVLQGYFGMQVFKGKPYFSTKLVSKLKRGLVQKTRGYFYGNTGFTHLSYNETLELFFTCCLGVIIAVQDTVKGKPVEKEVLQEFSVLSNDLTKQCANFGVRGGTR